MRVAFLTSDPDSASARIRIRDHLPGLQERGIEGELVTLPKGLLRRRRVIGRLAQHDVVVLHRRLLDPLSLGALRRNARSLVLDLDDAIWERPFRPRSLRNRLRFVHLLRKVDLVVVGSAWLQAQVSERHAHVRLVRPAPPPTQLEPDPDPSARRLVWTGSQATLPYLESLAPVLAELAATRNDLVLDVVADAQPQLPNVPMKFHPWSLATEAEVVRRAHVGLYPLRDDPWSQGKCAYKALLYMSLGVPVVASPQGGGAEVLQGTGLLAKTRPEWAAALGQLLDDPPRRAALGTAAQALSRARDDHAQRTETLSRALQEAAQPRGRPARDGRG